MSQRSGSFWLSFANHWIKAVTVIGTAVVAYPGFRMIDSVMISGSDDWNMHGPILMSGLAYVACAVLVLAGGLAVGDLLRLLLRWEAQLQQQETLLATQRPEPMLAPLPTSKALLESLGIGAPQPARVHVTSGFHHPS